MNVKEFRVRNDGWNYRGHLPDTYFPARTLCRVVPDQTTYDRLVTLN